MARILLYDVESFPHVSLTWGKWQQDVIAFVRESIVCSISWKWLGEEKVEVIALPDFPGYDPKSNDNTAMMLAFHKVLSSADISIAHNGDRFDDLKVNADLFKLGILPPPPRKTIDTLKVARRHFKLPSNKLDDLAQILGVGSKLKHPGIQLWIDCMDGKPEAWELMKRYNQHDVHPLLEGVYLKLRPWISNHPDLTDYSRDFGCPACESKDLTKQGWALAKTSARRRYTCNACGKWSLGNKISLSKMPPKLN